MSVLFLRSIFVYGQEEIPTDTSLQEVDLPPASEYIHIGTEPSENINTEDIVQQVSDDPVSHIKEAEVNDEHTPSTENTSISDYDDVSTVTAVSEPQPLADEAIPSSTVLTTNLEGEEMSLHGEVIDIVHSTTTLLTSYTYTGVGEVPVVIFKRKEGDVHVGVLEMALDAVTDSIADAFGAAVEVVGQQIETITDAALDLVQPVAEMLFSLTIDSGPDEGSGFEEPISEDHESTATDVSTEEGEVVTDTATKDVEVTVEEPVSPALEEVPLKQDNSVSDEVPYEETAHADEVLTETVPETSSHDEAVTTPPHESGTGFVEPLSHPVAIGGEKTESASTSPTLVSSTTEQLGTHALLDGVLVPFTYTDVDTETFSIAIGDIPDPGMHTIQFVSYASRDVPVVYDAVFIVGGLIESKHTIREDLTVFVLSDSLGELSAWLKVDTASLHGYILLAQSSTFATATPFFLLEDKILWMAPENLAYMGYDLLSGTFFSQSREIKRRTLLDLEEGLFTVSFESGPGEIDAVKLSE